MLHCGIINVIRHRGITEPRRMLCVCPPFWWYGKAMTWGGMFMPFGGGMTEPCWTVAQAMPFGIVVLQSHSAWWSGQAQLAGGMGVGMEGVSRSEPWCATALKERHAAHKS